MALMTITVRRDAESGRTTVWVGLRSDEDALPHEHEELHRRLVAGLLPAAAVGRERPAREPVVG
jgi:hypothetical protein